jgi:hypothetical protein
MAFRNGERVRDAPGADGSVAVRPQCNSSAMAASSR